MDSGIKLETMPKTAWVSKDLSGLAKFTSIQAAINYAKTQSPSATNPWTILIYPGIYDEAITTADWVNLKGIGPKGSVVISQADETTVILLGLDATMQIQNLTVRLAAPTTYRSIVTSIYGFTSHVSFTDVVLECPAPGAHAITVFDLCADGSYLIERCSYNIGGTGNSRGILNSGPTPVFRLIDNDFEFNNVNAYHISTNQYGTWTGEGNRWAGTCGMFEVSNATFIFDNDAMICTGAWANMTNSIMTLRRCAIEAPVFAYPSGIIRLKECSYRKIQRLLGGNIVDESPQLQDAPWKVHKWNWMTALANMDVAVRGTPLDAGSGQVLLEVTDNVAGQEAVEANPEAAGALANQFTPDRTPRFMTQISVDSFDPHVTMFFGLRATLGNAIPGPAEDHAGFDWDGTNFRAISSDGGGVGVQTNLTTPSVDAQHQLEVIVFGDVGGAGSVEFYVDGMLVATHTAAAGKPNAAMDWQHLLATAGGGGGDVIQVTVRNGGCQECPS